MILPKKLIKNNKFEPRFVELAFIVEHSYNEFYKEKDLVDITLDISPKHMKRLEKIAKEFKVSLNSILVAAIVHHIEKKEKSPLAISP